MNISWTFVKILVLIAMFICGCCVILGVMMIGAGISIYTVENLEFEECLNKEVIIIGKENNLENYLKFFTKIPHEVYLSYLKRY